MTALQNAAQTLKGRYTQLETLRSPALTRAREAAILTIPALVPPEGFNGATKLYTPYQGLGARGVNNLAAKLLLALLPPNSPFFRLMISDQAMAELTGRDDVRGEIEKALSSIERAVLMEIEAKAMRVGIHEGLKQLIVAGNVLLYLAPDGGLRVFRLDRYVVMRDPMGNVLEIIVRETVAPEVLPEELVDAVRSEKPTNSTPEKTLDLYTGIKRDRNQWVIHQEVEGIMVPGSRGTYPLDKSPWMPLRWTRVDGDDYGRGHVEEYIGDIKSLEGLSKAILEGSAVAARVITMVNPNGVTDEDDVTEAENLDVISGQEGDVTFLQVSKFADFQVAKDAADTLSERLGYAFMLNTSIQRNGERVTAEEIRYMAGELEDALGGVYSILSQELQLPFVTRIMHTMQRAKKLPTLPKGTVNPTITTGLEALGRGHDLNKLDLFLRGAIEALGPEAVAAALNAGEYLSRRGASLGIDMNGLIRSQEEQAAQQQQAMMMQLLQQLGPNAINQLGGIAQKGMEQGNGQ